MANAFLSRLFASFRALAALFAPAAASSPAAESRAFQPQPAARCRKPLRVVRVLEPSAPRSAGRMVISGRLADVCAELERLAALETRGC